MKCITFEVGNRLSRRLKQAMLEIVLVRDQIDEVVRVVELELSQRVEEALGA
jgi:N-acetylmuramoyl-L-alanine amidase